MSNLVIFDSAKNEEPIWHKVIEGKGHPSFFKSRSPIPLGIAFRTASAPVGYLPFYAKKDFDFSGSVSFSEEWVISRLPFDLSGIASPHMILLNEAASDVTFLGSGSPDFVDIQQAVKADLLQNAMQLSASAFLDGIMLALGGPTVSKLVGAMIKSKLKQFIVSKSISAALKKKIKEKSGAAFYD